MITRIILILSVSTLFSACKSKKDEEAIMVPAQESYSKGIDFLKSGKFADAADEFGKVYYQHPGEAITPYAELMEAYSLYQARKYQDAVDVIDHFIMIHPAHQDLPYAYYLKGLSYYMQISDIHHDQGITEITRQVFTELTNRFPHTKYSIDASMKLDLVNDKLAGKEMDVGRYYQKRQNPIGAINRFQTIIEEYQTTTHTPEALYRLVESFCILGITEEAQKYTAVLAHNYPSDKWTKYAMNLMKRK